MKRLIAMLTLAALLLAGCGSTGELEHDVSKSPSRVPEFTEGAMMDLGLDILRANAGEDSTLISPLSVLSALAMTANGAEGDTLTEMEMVLGGTREELNRWMDRNMDSLSREALRLANSIWIKEDDAFTVQEAFVTAVEDIYRAEVRTVPFDDTTLQAINGWVDEKTDGMIPEILDEISEDAILYLINALAFDARWAEPYSESSVREGIFTAEDGQEQAAELMYAEGSNYLETEQATGFLRWYEDQEYAFAALLPKDGVTVEELLESLTGEDLLALVSDPQKVTVYSAIPKFESETSLGLADTLKAMGMEDAFHERLANFSGMGSYAGGNLYISRVLHNTRIRMAEQGTQAGAATVVEVNRATGAIGAATDVKTVHLDRPFVYLILDGESRLPVFMGTCMDVRSLP